MKRFVTLNLGLTLTIWLIAAFLAIVTTYLYAVLRGDMMPNGTFAWGGPRSHWVSINFRAFLPSFLGVASVLGVLVGQLLFFAWIKQDRNPGA